MFVLVFCIWLLKMVMWMLCGVSIDFVVNVVFICFIVLGYLVNVWLFIIILLGLSKLCSSVIVLLSMWVCFVSSFLVC